MKLLKGQTKSGIGVVISVILWQYVLGLLQEISPYIRENNFISQVILAFVIGYFIYPKIVVSLGKAEKAVGGK